MAVNTDFSALRLKKENIVVFQDLKLAYESRHFVRLSNDAFFNVLTNLALSSSLELSSDYDRVLAQRYPAPATEPESAGEEDMPAEIAPLEHDDSSDDASSAE